MTVTVKLFAGAREVAGTDELKLELSEGASFSELRSKLASSHPPLAVVCGRALFAADARYVGDDELVPAVGEIAMIPPVSGG